MKINFYGLTTPFYGYGRATLEWMTALQRNGCDISIGWERRNEKDPEWQYYSEEEKVIFKKPFEKRKIGIIKIPAFSELFKNNQSDFKIILTMVENTKVCQDWVNVINSADMVFVPCRFLVNVFRESGVFKPIYLTSQGVNLKTYYYYERPKRKVFTFGTAGWLDDRKNVREMIMAFSLAFPDRKDVRLVLKNNNPKLYWRSKDKRVKVINKNYSQEEMFEFYKSLDCFLCPSRAEGSGLPPREAMATGLPSILTNFSGLEEIAKEDISYPLNDFKVDLSDMRSFDPQPGFQARINLEELVYWMRYVYENQDEAKEKGKKASQFIAKNYNWDLCAKKMIKILKEINENS